MRLVPALGGLVLASLAQSWVAAQVPAEVTGLRLGAASTLTWSATPRFRFLQRVPRRPCPASTSGTPARCHGNGIGGTIVRAAARARGQGRRSSIWSRPSRPPAKAGAGERVERRRCAPAVGTLHAGGAQPRLRPRWATAGTNGRATASPRSGSTRYIDEQLDPDSIERGGQHRARRTRLAPARPARQTSSELIARQVVGGVYARRQLAEQVGQLLDQPLQHGQSQGRRTTSSACSRGAERPAGRSAIASYPQRRTARSCARARLAEFDVHRR